MANEMRQGIMETLGNKVEGLMNWEQAAEKHLNFSVEKHPIPNPLNGEPSDYFGLVRIDNETNEIGDVLNTVKKGYQVNQPKDLFSFTNELIGVDGFHFENVGQLDGGRKIFTQANIGEYDIMASGDKHKTFLTGLDSYDGSCSQTWSLVDFRVYCRNTFRAALAEMMLKFKHTKNADVRRQESLKLLRSMRDSAKTIKEKLEILAQRRVSGDVLRQTIVKMFHIDLSKISKQE